MSDTGKIARNSLWLIAAPLCLNVLSLAVTAAIARLLGKVDYGRFVFANQFALMFMPIGDLGLRALTIRSLAEKPPDPGLVAGRFLAARGLFVLVGYLALLVAIHVLGYPPETTLAACVMGATIIPRALTTVAHDAFEAHEQMKYVAYTDLAAGASLTVLSVVVLLLGYRLIPLVSVYVVGRTAGLVLAGYYLTRYFVTPRLSLDGAFIRSALVQGATFFYPTFLYSISQRLGIVMLSKLGSEALVGSYGAASELVDRLTVIPDGVSGAFFPTVIRVHRDSPEEAQGLFRKFYGYSALLALPIAVGGTLTAPQIIDLIYGPTYADSVVVFQLLVWWLFLRFFNSLASWTLGAIHEEKRPAITVLTSVPIFLATAAISIPYGGQAALATAAVFLELMCFSQLSFHLHRVFSPQLFDRAFSLKVALASAVMGAAVVAVERFVPMGKWVLLVSIPAGVVVYGAAIVLLGAVTPAELKGLGRTLRKRQ